MIWLTLILSLLLTPVAASAATYHVRPTGGSDSNNGTSFAAGWATPQKCTDTAVAGDTCLFYGGTDFSLTSNWWIYTSGSSGNPITYKAAPGESPKISCSINLGTGCCMPLIRDTNYEASFTSISDIVLQGFEITGCWYGVRVDLGNRITISQNYFHDNYWQGIGASLTNSTLDRNKMISNGVPACNANAADCDHVHNYYLEGRFNTISNSLILSAPAYGIQLAGFTDATQFPGDFSGARDISILNNTFAKQGYSGIVIWEPDTGSDVNNITIKNNIFDHNGLSILPEANGVARLDAAGGHVINNNIFNNDSGSGQTSVNNGLVTSGSGTWNTASGNLTSTATNYANVVNTATNDYHLQSGSPALDTGASVSLTTDYDGNSRPQNSSYDIGAYEFVISTDTGQRRSRGMEREKNRIGPGRFAYHHAPEEF